MKIKALTTEDLAAMGDALSAAKVKIEAGEVPPTTDILEFIEMAQQMRVELLRLKAENKRMVGSFESMMEVTTREERAKAGLGPVQPELPFVTKG